jgi:hypothetical protein
MPMSPPRNQQDQAELDAINSLGKQCVKLLTGYGAQVMCNVAAAMLVGAIKAAGLSRDDMYDCVDAFWENDPGIVVFKKAKPS